MVTHGIRMNAGITTFHRTFIVPFVNDSTLIHSVRMTGIFSPAISSIRSDVTITKMDKKIFLIKNYILKQLKNLTTWYEPQ
jgi:hypothetical protein